MKIAVIGSNSFLAKEIIKSKFFEKENFILYGINNENLSPEFVYFKYPETNISFEDLLKTDAIIYCAGAGIQSNLNEDIELLYELNTFFPIRLLNFLNKKSYKGKTITFGSYFEIGENDSELAFNEDMILKSDNKIELDYTKTKKLLSTYISINKLNFPHFHLFLSTIYSKTESENRLIPYVIDKIKTNQNLEFTKGLQVRQYLHTSDLVRFIKLIFENNDIESGFYNVAPDESYSVKEIVQFIFKALNKPLDENCFNKIKGRDDTMKVLKMNNSKIKNLGFKTEIDIETGIKMYL